MDAVPPHPILWFLLVRVFPVFEIIVITPDVGKSSMVGEANWYAAVSP